MAEVEMAGVRKVYENGFVAIPELDLSIAEGEAMVLVGPSGCGKSTLLRMIAGLESISAGEVRFGGRIVNDADARSRDVAMVFQNYALYPHMTVAQNIGFPLKLQKLPKDQIRQRVEEAAQILGLTPWLGRKPAQLSGGQRQRVAMGRAIVRDPQVFLMDEPLSNLDAKLRVQMRAEVMAIQRRVGVATVYVTHDQIEAMTMGDRVAVMHGGHLQQVGEAQTIYDCPANLFVAAFIGSPAMNLYEAQLGESAAELILGSARLRLPERVLSMRPALARYANSTVVVGIRPEALRATDKPTAGASMTGEIGLLEALGNEQHVHFRTDAKQVLIDDDKIDDELDHGGSGIARVDPHLRLRVGDNIAFDVDASKLHFFDPETQEAIPVSDTGAVPAPGFMGARSAVSA